MGRSWQTTLDLDPQSASEMTHPEVPGQFQGTVRTPRSGRWPRTWKSPPLPQNSWNNPPNLLAYEITQPVKANHAKFRGCTRPLRWPTFCLWSVLLSVPE